MSRMRRLSDLEQRLKHLIEGGFARLFAGYVRPGEVASRLARAMDELAQADPNGDLVAPNLFTVALNPVDYSQLEAAHPDLAGELSRAIVDLAGHAGMVLRHAPAVEIQPDPALAQFAIEVRAAHSVEERSATQEMPAIQAEHLIPPIKASFLIYQAQHLPLNQPVTNIGRRQDNHIVVHDVRVSRNHAQIRERFGSFVLYDLGSTSGTFVNGARITECILKPGDVIGLAGVNMIFVQDESTTGAHKFTDTQMRRPSDEP